MTAEHSFADLLSRRVVIGDGAMGTMLYQRGVFINRCFDQLNITNPEIVKAVHDGYVQAGADFIETNTFGANEFKLARYGLAEQVEKINLAAAGIAAESAGRDVFVAGAIGPLGLELTEHSRLTEKKAAAVFQRQANALIEGGVDLLILETFSSTRELLIAIHSLEEITQLCVVAQMTVNEYNQTIYGERVDQAIAQVAAEDIVTAVGLNCSVGPSGMLSSLKLIRDVTDKPISVQPNAGMPRQIDNRTIYMCTPEYMAEYAKRFFENGAGIIGGCCGTTPEHINQIVRAVRPLDRITRHTSQAPRIVVGAPAEIESCPKVPLAEKSHLGAKLAAGRKITTIEITPPRGPDVGKIIDSARLCAELGIDAINIPDGPRASLRLSPLVTAVRIQEHAGIEAILHYCCRDRNLIGMQSDLLGAFAIGLRNVLVITGDPPKAGSYPEATGVFDLDSIALTGVLRNLNCGIDIAQNRFTPAIRLAIGVGANPAAANPDREVDRFRRKVEAGAEFAITQPVFDADVLLHFLEVIEPFKIPIIAGIWPFTSFKNAEFMANEVPGVVVPDGLLKRMNRAKNSQHGRAIGVEIAAELIGKIGDYVSGFAVSAPFGDVKMSLASLGKLDIGRI